MVVEGEGKRWLHFFNFSDRHQIDLGFFTTAFRESDELSSESSVA